jgi:hypothetical protein
MPLLSRLIFSEYKLNLNNMPTIKHLNASPKKPRDKKTVITSTYIEFQAEQCKPNTPTEKISVSAFFERQPLTFLIDPYTEEIVGKISVNVKGKEILQAIHTNEKIGKIKRNKDTGYIEVYSKNNPLKNSKEGQFFLSDTITRRQFYQSQRREKTVTVLKGTCIKVNDGLTSANNLTEILSYWQFMNRKARKSNLQNISIEVNTPQEVHTDKTLAAKTSNIASVSFFELPNQAVPSSPSLKSSTEGASDERQDDIVWEDWINFNPTT